MRFFRNSDSFGVFQQPYYTDFGAKVFPRYGLVVGDTTGVSFFGEGVFRNIHFFWVLEGPLREKT